MTLAGVRVLSVVSSNASEIVVRAGAYSVNRTGDGVITSDTGAVVSGANLFSYEVAGSVASVSPSFGQLDTIVTISGTRLLGDGMQLVSVHLRGVLVKQVVSFNESVVVVVANSSSSIGSGDVVLTVETGGMAHVL